MASTIQIPDDAPFTPEQRAWLGSFLAKLLQDGATTPPAATAAVPVTLLFGSQTGNAEGLAKKFAKSLKKSGFDPEMHDLAAYDRARLPQEKNLLVITSTYGDGEPPDNAADFHRWLLAETAPRLNGVRFSVLALGDTSYPDFCKCGIEIDTRLEVLGATRLFKRVDSDVDYDPPFAEWSAGVIAALAPSRAVMLATAPAVDAIEEGHSKKNPFPAPVLRNFNLNGPGPKETHHVELSLDGSGMAYEVGDALGVIPSNQPEVVDELISHLPFRAADVPLPGGGEAPLRDALIHHYDIGTLNKSVIQKWQKRSGSPFLRALVEGDDKAAWDAFCWGRDLIDLVIDHPADFSDAEEFVSILKKLQPRLYSIASSPRAHPGEVHLCVAIVRYHTHGRKRGGICSTYLSDRLAAETRPRTFVHTNKAFRLPENGDTPLIMVGPGTGIAPFRAFLEDRKATGATGRNWLFFGNPHQATDFLYREELEGYLNDGVLTRLDLAWSRDQKEKCYVQHLMLRDGAALWQWLQEGAAFYVCGDASRMAKDVESALLQIAADHGQLDEAGAKEFLASLKKDKRYQRDVY